MKIIPIKIHSMENDNIYTADEIEFFKFIENQKFEPMEKMELKLQKNYWQTVAEKTIKKLQENPSKY